MLRFDPDDLPRALPEGLAEHDVWLRKLQVATAAEIGMELRDDYKMLPSSRFAAYNTPRNRDRLVKLREAAAVRNAAVAAEARANPTARKRKRGAASKHPSKRPAVDPAEACEVPMNTEEDAFGHVDDDMSEDEEGLTLMNEGYGC